MTRDEAIAIAKRVGNDRPWYDGVIDLLVDLGLLELETTTDKDRIAAVNYLRLHGYPSSANVIVADLLHGGFKITKDPA